MRTLLTARWLCTPLEQMAIPLLIEDGLIVDLDSRRQRALPLMTRNPALVLQQTFRRGTLAVGAVGDVVVLSPEGQVREAFIAGRPVSAGPV
ncbi:MAG: hypothetical protein ACYC6M_05735 [Terriglobales bacterium]